MAWLSRLFGRAPAEAGEPAPAKPTAEIEHGGFTIRAMPYRAEGGQYQTAGSIVATVDGTEHEQAFVRADRFASIEDATSFSLQKGRQIVDEQGRTLFRTKPAAS